MYSQTVQIFLVRHAEKELQMGENPPLTAMGEARAKVLANLLRSQTIQAVYSTSTLRTQQTIQPIAKQTGLEIQYYTANTQYDFFDSVIAKAKQNVIHDPNSTITIVIVGHSNTIPALLQHLTQSNAAISIEDEEYDNLFLLSLTEKTIPSFVRLRIEPK